VLLKAACCDGVDIDTGLRNHQGRQAREFSTQLVFLNKIFKQAEVRIIRQRLKGLFSINCRDYHSVNHTNLNLAARKGLFYSKKTLKTHSGNMPVKSNVLGLSKPLKLEDLDDDDMVNCDASLSSHSNVLSHQGLCLVQQLDTKSIHKRCKEDLIDDTNKFKHYFNAVTRNDTQRWLRL